VPKWVVRVLQAVFVVAFGAAFCLTGMVAVSHPFVNVSADCVNGQLPHPSPFTIFGDCVKPPGYVPWMVIFGVIGAALGVLLALGLIQLFGRIRPKSWRTKLAT